MGDYERRIQKQRVFYASEERDLLLGVRINPQTPNRYPYEEILASPKKALDTALSSLEPSLNLDTDFVPCVYPIQFRMIHPIPSLFGCGMRIVSDDVRAVPILDRIEQVRDLEAPSRDRGILPLVIEHLEYYKKNAPPELPITPPGEQSPFVIAYQLRGDAIFLDLYDHPEEVKRLLELITDTFIRVERLYKDVLSEPSEYRVSFQYLFVPGLRIAADSDVMLSGYDFVKLIHTQLAPYLADGNTNRGGHNFKLASIWEIEDFPGFLRRNREKLRQSRGTIFFVQVETKEEAQALIRQWPELRAELLD